MHQLKFTVFSIAFMIAATAMLVDCSSPPPADLNVPTTGTPSPTPKKTPIPPEIKPETVWRCKISNGEGRIFIGEAETTFAAETKARDECTRAYRHCVILDCSPI